MTESDPVRPGSDGSEPALASEPPASESSSMGALLWRRLLLRVLRLLGLAYVGMALLLWTMQESFVFSW